MKKLGLYVGVALAISASSAHAQMAVFDATLNSTGLGTLVKEGMTAVNTAETVLNTAATVNSVMHGNFMALDRLAPGLMTSELLQPLGLDSGALANTLGGAEQLGQLGGKISGLYQQAQGMTNYYVPNGSDFRSMLNMSTARSIAGQLALSKQMMDSTAERQQMIPGLLSATAATRDVKDAVDAGTTVAGQQLAQTSQTNQLLALQLYSQAEERRERAVQDQAWMQGADTLYATAKAAANRAASGQVELVSDDVTQAQ
jgi:hypothetical protein